MEDTLNNNARQPILRLRAEPRTTNAHGRVQAGWLLHQIDLAGATFAERKAKGAVTTVAVNAFQFAHPIHVGDVVSIYADCLRLGQKSVTVKITVEAERMSGEMLTITDLVSTYVAIDAEGRSRLI
jgi:acyl-CoA thioesterase YciA